MNKILVLGGTRFIGRALVERLVAAGTFDVTLFHRGVTGGDLFPGLRRIRGDRDTPDLHATANEDWDALVDLSCYFPRPLREFLPRIAGRVGRYVFVSTGSVYQRTGSGIYLEDSPLVDCPPEREADPSAETYGPRKVACERALSATPDLDCVILRPSIVYGAHDPTDRLYFWLRRIATRERVILPGGGIHPCTWTFVDDLARLLEEAIALPRHRSFYNTPTHAPIALRALLGEASGAAGTAPRFVEVSEETLRREGVRPGADLPLWFGKPFILDGARLREDFTTCPAPFAESLARTLAHCRTLGLPPCRAGISDAREDALLSLLATK